jgi:hypothetical protein
VNPDRFSMSQGLPFLLMTRFALRPDAEISDWQAPSAESRSTPRYLDEAWLSKRLQWFEQICSPSVRGQGDQSFDWLIGVSSEVSTSWVNRIEIAAGERARILRVDPEFSFSQARRELGYGEEFISARLDSDDAISSDFVARVKNTIAPGWALCLFHGVQLNESPRGLFHRFSRSNSFSAFWTLGGRDVFDLGRHKEIGTSVPLRNSFTLHPCYLVYVHDSNTSRYSKRGPLVFRPSQVLASFRLPPRFRPSFRDQTRLLWSTSMGAIDRRFPRLSPNVGVWRQRVARMLPMFQRSAPKG